MFSTADYHVQGPQIHQFNNISPNPVPRSAFKRDFTRRSTLNENVLVPIFVDEILPGDDVNLRMTAFARMSTPIKPVMDNLYLETHWFFVPYRLVWDNWEKFQGQQTNPSDSVAYLIPTLTDSGSTGFEIESIHDYFGLPTLVTGLTGISSLYHRGYQLIWNEWYRDESLQDSIVVPKGDGPDDPAQFVLKRRNKRKDYFTSALPWPQKGNAVNLGLGATAPVVPTVGVLPKMQINGATKGFYADSEFWKSLEGSAGGTGEAYWQTSGLHTDLSATSVSINALRQVALYQQILELDARGGTRYVESIYSRFGVISPDFRLQRPELIGQGSTRVNVYSVPQTQATSEGVTPQGNLAAFGTVVASGDHGCRYSATEHGMIIGLANIRADLTYQQGIPKMFTRSTRLDFYEPLLNGLGEQSVLNEEIFAQGLPADKEVFGYQERFAEYRFKNSEITGKFRSSDPQSLDVWHLGQQFASLPGMNEAFIQEDVPMDRVLAVTDEPSFLFDAHFSYNHVRPMPIRSNPGIDRL